MLSHFLTWQKQEGNRKKLSDFAEYVKVDYKVLDNVFNGRRGLSRAVADQLAKALNDYRFYDLAEMERPDPLTFYIERNLEKASEDGKKQIADIIAKYTSEDPPKDP